MPIIPPQNYPQRLLKPSTVKYIPSIWLFLDVETTATARGKTETHRFHLGWSCLWIRSRKNNRGFTRWKFHISEIELNHTIENLVFRYGAVTLVGHNIFFDLQASGFFDHFTRWGWKLEFYYDKGLTYILKCKKDKSLLTIVSTTNWFDQSLEQLGRVLGLEKLDVDFSSATWDELKIYCRRDVEILVKAVKYYLDFIVKNDLGKFSLTKASQAFTAFRYRFMDHKIFIHENPDVLALERQAYHGGRVEAFFIGQCKGGPFVTLDINSMYPYVMKREKYPYKLCGYYQDETPERWLEVLRTYAVIAEIEVSTPEAAFAVKYKGKTIFPTGTFTCFVCSAGLNYALTRGFVNKIKRASVYRKTDLFTGYVDYFHKIRQRYIKKDNDTMSLLCKYMHNSMYGKFGQLGINSDISDSDTGREYWREEIFDMVTKRMWVVSHLMGKKIVQYSEGEGEYSNVAIAAHVTENARFALWDVMQDVGLKRVLYCDTDGVKIREKDLKYLSWPMNDTDLGALKIENRSRDLYIGGAKNYRTESIRKIKGIPRKAVEISPGVFEFASFGRQTAHLRAGEIAGAKVKTVIRELKTPYDKGKVLASGKVIPWAFPQKK